MRILKCRQTGDTGVGGELYFDKAINRLTIPSSDIKLSIKNSDEKIEEF